MRKLIVRVLVVILVLMLSVPITAAQDAEPEMEAWVCPEEVKEMENKTLNIFNWSTYIGETTVADFEALCGVTITYDTYESNDFMLSRLRAGNPGYDIVVPSDYSVPTMIVEELLQPLDLSKIPNFANLSEDLRTSPYDPESEYALPYLWGTFGIGYDTAKVETEVASWVDFFEYDGPVAWVDDGRAMLSIALVMVGADPNSTDAAEIESAKEYLLAHLDNVVVIAQDDGQELLARGEVDMVIEYNGDIYQLNLDCECEQYAYVIPREGTGISAGFIGVPTDAQNPELAMIFIDYILDPQVSADIANYTAYPSPNQQSIELGLIDEALLNNEGIYPGEEARANLYFVLENADAENLYNDAWDEIKIAAAS